MHTTFTHTDMTSALSSWDQICRGSLLTLKVMGTQTYTRGKHDFHQGTGALEKQIGLERWTVRSAHRTKTSRKARFLHSCKLHPYRLKRDHAPLPTEWPKKQRPAAECRDMERMLKCAKVQFVNLLNTVIRQRGICAGIMGIESCGCACTESQL